MDEIIDISDAIDQYCAAVDKMPTKFMRYLFRVCIDESDIEINERTLYVPLPNDNATRLLEAEQIAFFKSIDMAFHTPIDSVVYWIAKSLQCQFKRIWHPIYLAEYSTDCANTCKFLKCIPSQYIDYILWFQENADNFNTQYLNGHGNLCQLSEYIEKMAEYNSQKENEK